MPSLPNNVYYELLWLSDYLSGHRLSDDPEFRLDDIAVMRSSLNSKSVSHRSLTCTFADSRTTNRDGRNRKLVFFVYACFI